MKWIERQEGYGGAWLVMDDSEEPYSLPSQIGSWEIIHVYAGACPKTEWGLISQARLYVKGIEILNKASSLEFIVMIGDDDYYKPGYVKDLVARAVGVEAVGAARALYIMPGVGTWHLNNRDHSAMESTAFRPGRAADLFKLANVEMSLEPDRLYWSDKRFWDKVIDAGLPHGLFYYGEPSQYQTYGLKGHKCGRPGISDPHRMPGKFKPTKLNTLIPKEDLAEIERAWN